jgi:hypothetical protein
MPKLAEVKQKRKRREFENSQSGSGGTLGNLIKTEMKMKVEAVVKTSTVIPPIDNSLKVHQENPKKNLHLCYIPEFGPKL